MNTNKLVIGLTGGIGSGKTAASDYLASKGADVVDADICARIVVETGKPALKKIAKHFGEDILLSSGELDRAKLRSIIFNSPEEKRWLESLLHPLIRAEIITQLNSSQSSYAIFVSPLLLETDQFKLCDRILVIDVPEALQLERASSRDNNDPEQIKRIIASQIPRSDRLEKADDIVENSGDVAQLQQKLDTLHQQYLALVKT